MQTKTQNKKIIIQGEKKFFVKGYSFHDNCFNLYNNAEYLVRENYKNIDFIPKLLNVNQNDTELVMTYEYVDFIPYNKLVKLNVSNKIDIMIKILECFDFLHSNGIVHCDVKSANILIDKNYCPHIVDFESCVLNNRYFGYSFGSINYCSPEHYAHQIPDSRSDIYSLGIVFYYLMFGVLPFSGKKEDVAQNKIENKYKLSNDLELNKILVKSIQSNREVRYSNVQLFINDLLKYKGVNR